MKHGESIEFNIFADINLPFLWPLQLPAFHRLTSVFKSFVCIWLCRVNMFVFDRQVKD